MLGSCATVEDAVAFYRKYAEYGFSSARILIADKTGKSVIIVAKEGELFFKTSSQTRGFGYGMYTLNKILTSNLQPGVEVGLPILQACLQSGVSATKYSNVFDLTEGSITLIPALTEEKNEI